MRLPIILIAAAIAAPGLAADDWHPSKYGAADTIGAMNNLSAKSTVKAAKLINIATLVVDNVTEFMFVLGTPRFKGTVQMVVNPVAIR